MTRSRRSRRAPAGREVTRAPAGRDATRTPAGLAPPGGGLRPLTWIVIGALVAVALGTWWAIHVRTLRRAMSSAPDALAAMAPDQAYREAIELAGEGRFDDSFPYYRRALAGLNQDFWEVHYNYGISLGSRALQYTTRGGAPAFATRSSIERIGLEHEAMRQLDRAVRIAPTPRIRAEVLDHFSNSVAVWGFPWERLDLMRKRQDADPGDEVAALRARQWLRMMRDPDQYAEDMSVGDAVKIRPARVPRSSP